MKNERATRHARWSSLRSSFLLVISAVVARLFISTISSFICRLVSLLLIAFVCCRRPTFVFACLIRSFTYAEYFFFFMPSLLFPLPSLITSFFRLLFYYLSTGHFSDSSFLLRCAILPRRFVGFMLVTIALLFICHAMIVTFVTAWVARLLPPLLSFHVTPAFDILLRF